MLMKGLQKMGLRYRPDSAAVCTISSTVNALYKHCTQGSGLAGVFQRSSNAFFVFEFSSCLSHHCNARPGFAPAVLRQA
jgi:hypothetical protein